MNFSSAVQNNVSRTENDMKAFTDTSSACVDLFFIVGASRGFNIIPQFQKAYIEDPQIALKIAMWARDIRAGAGERQFYKDILNYLEGVNMNHAKLLLDRISIIGRWDDGFVVNDEELFRYYVENHVAPALVNRNALCAKWCPRKGKIADKIRKILDLSPKQYRKLIVGISETVETLMCEKRWEDINFSKVPSLAHSRYRNAFYRNAGEIYRDYVNALVDPDNTSVKINAGAVYPYDVIKGIDNNLSDTEIDVMNAQWNALPNYIGDSKALPMVDVSGSMDHHLISSNLTALNVAISLGLYMSEKNLGAFKDLILTFSGNPELVKITGNVYDRYKKLGDADWGLNTNLHKAFYQILQVAISGNVSQRDMPETLVIFSDMQFDECIEFDDTAYEMIHRKYEKYGYIVPKIVFWNIVFNDNVPVKYNQIGVALVSGFSPIVAQAVLSGNFEEFTPYNIMMRVLSSNRYDF